MQRSPALLTLLRLTFISRVSLAVAQTCFFPNGDIAEDDLPCNATAPSSACCGNNAMCMENGICFGSGLLSRGSCTDRDWQDPACCAYCQALVPWGGVGISPCSSRNEFVCGNDLCNDTDAAFAVDGGWRTVLRPSQLNLAMADAGLIPSSAAYSSSLFFSAGAASSTPPATASGLSAPSSTCSDAPRSGSFTASDIVAAVLGTGLPLAISLVAALVLLWRARRSRALLVKNEPAASPVGSLGEERSMRGVEMDSANSRHELVGHSRIELG